MSSHPRLAHDCAHKYALRLLGLVANCLREEEYRDAFEEFYALVRECVEEYEEKRVREERRLRPGRL